MLGWFTDYDTDRAFRMMEDSPRCIVEQGVNRPCLSLVADFYHTSRAQVQSFPHIYSHDERSGSQRIAEGQITLRMLDGLRLEHFCLSPMRFNEELMASMKAYKDDLHASAVKSGMPVSCFEQALHSTALYLRCLQIHIYEELMRGDDRAVFSLAEGCSKEVQICVPSDYAKEVPSLHWASIHHSSGRDRETNRRLGVAKSRDIVHVLAPLLNGAHTGATVVPIDLYEKNGNGAKWLTHPPRGGEFSGRYADVVGRPSVQTVTINGNVYEAPIMVEHDGEGWVYRGGNIISDEIRSEPSPREVIGNDRRPSDALVTMLEQGSVVFPGALLSLQGMAGQGLVDAFMRERSLLSALRENTRVDEPSSTEENPDSTNSDSPHSAAEE